jgi:hypothetical protein
LSENSSNNSHYEAGWEIGFVGDRLRHKDAKILSLSLRLLRLGGSFCCIIAVLKVESAQVLGHCSQIRRMGKPRIHQHGRVS